MAEIAPRFNPHSGAKINNTIPDQNHVGVDAIGQNVSWEILPVGFTS